MDVFFVRVYTLHDGRKLEVNAVYESYDMAVTDLPKFNLDGLDISDVAYARVEKRYSPTRIWGVSFFQAE